MGAAALAVAAFAGTGFLAGAGFLAESLVIFLGTTRPFEDFWQDSNTGPAVRKAPSHRSRTEETKVRRCSTPVHPGTNASCYCNIRQGERSDQPLIAADAHFVSLSLWQTLQALGMAMASVCAGVTK